MIYGHRNPKQSHQCHYDGLVTFHLFYPLPVLRQYITYKLWATQIIFALDLFCGGGLIEHVGRFDPALLYPQVAHYRDDLHIQSDEMFDASMAFFSPVLISISELPLCHVCRRGYQYVYDRGLASLGCGVLHLVSSKIQLSKLLLSCEVSVGITWWIYSFCLLEESKERE